MNEGEKKMRSADGYEPSDEMINYMQEVVTLEIQRAELGSIGMLATKGFQAYVDEYKKGCGDFESIPRDQSVIFMSNMHGAFLKMKHEAEKINNEMPDI